MTGWGRLLMRALRPGRAPAPPTLAPPGGNDGTGRGVAALGGRALSPPRAPVDVAPDHRRRRRHRVACGDDDATGRSVGPVWPQAVPPRPVEGRRLGRRDRGRDVVRPRPAG